jgi:hypothetical protein
MCHCLECQRRTGAVISNQARFHRKQVTFGGQATAWRRINLPHRLEQRHSWRLLAQSSWSRVLIVPMNLPFSR